MVTSSSVNCRAESLTRHASVTSPAKIGDHPGEVAVPAKSVTERPAKGPAALAVAVAAAADE